MKIDQEPPCAVASYQIDVYYWAQWTVGIVARGYWRALRCAKTQSWGIKYHPIDCLIILTLGAPQTEAPRPPGNAFAEKLHVRARPKRGHRILTRTAGTTTKRGHHQGIILL